MKSDDQNGDFRDVFLTHAAPPPSAVPPRYAVLLPPGLLGSRIDDVDSRAPARNYSASRVDNIGHPPLDNMHHGYL